MKAIVLGSAAGGGFPQWNCRCAACAAAWASGNRRTQASVAISIDEKTWYLLDCSPDIREQISCVAALWPEAGLRNSPIQGVILTSGDIDHIAGLLSLREGHSFAIYGSRSIHEILDRNRLFDVLDRRIVRREVLTPGKTLQLADGLNIQLFATPGKAPLYLEDEVEGSDKQEEFTFGVEVSSNGGRFCYTPGCAEIDPSVVHRLARSDLALFDGTFWSDDEMIATGVGTKTARRMGHMPVGGSDGSLAQLTQLGVRRLIYTHVNNTNPMLLEDSPEHLAVLQAGAEVAYDGQAIEL